MKFKSELTKAIDYYNYLPVSQEQAQNILDDFGKRIICTINDEHSIHCALMNSKVVGYYIMISKKVQKQIKAEIGDTLTLEIQKDETKYGIPLSVEFVEVVETDPEAFELFEKLTPGKKRTIIHYVGLAKQSNTRINRAIKITENLKMGIKDLKELMR